MGTVGSMALWCPMVKNCVTHTFYSAMPDPASIIIFSTIWNFFTKSDPSWLMDSCRKVGSKTLRNRCGGWLQEHWLLVRRGQIHVWSHRECGFISKIFITSRLMTSWNWCYRWFVSCLVWVLWMKPESFGRVSSTLNCWSISPGPLCISYCIK